MPKAILQFKLKFLVIEVPDTTWPMLMAEDFFLPNKMPCVALMTHHSTGSVCIVGTSYPYVMCMKRVAMRSTLGPRQATTFSIVFEMFRYFEGN